MLDFFSILVASAISSVITIIALLIYHFSTQTDSDVYFGIPGGPTPPNRQRAPKGLAYIYDAQQKKYEPLRNSNGTPLSIAQVNYNDPLIHKTINNYRSLCGERELSESELISLAKRFGFKCDFVKKKCRFSELDFLNVAR